MEEPVPLSIGETIAASGLMGWLILILLIPTALLSLWGFFGKSLRLPLLSLALCLAMLWFGMLGTTGGFLVNLYEFEPDAAGGLTSEVAAGLAFSLLPLFFAILGGGSLSVLNVICLAVKAKPTP